MPELKSFAEIVDEWKNSGQNLDAALTLTKTQCTAFLEIINDDFKWNSLLNIVARGRKYDSWLAQDWPQGFDELILCAPLCKNFDWVCSECVVGKKQNGMSCANPDSIFGVIGEFLIAGERSKLIVHLNNIIESINSKNNWNTIERVFIKDAE